MTADHEPTECVCDTPEPAHIPLFDAWQCCRCFRGVTRLNNGDDQ